MVHTPRGTAARKFKGRIELKERRNERGRGKEIRRRSGSDGLPYGGGRGAGCGGGVGRKGGIGKTGTDTR